MTCARCNQPTIFRSGICLWCQQGSEQSPKASERREDDRLADRFADTLTERRLRHLAREGK